MGVGENARGQLGTGTMANSSLPVNVSNGERWKSIAAGDQTSSAVTSWGGLFSWGSNGDPYLPSSGTQDLRDLLSANAIGLGLDEYAVPIDPRAIIPTPIAVQPSRRFRSVKRSTDAGGGHVVAQTEEGRLMMWSYPGYVFPGGFSDECFGLGTPRELWFGVTPHEVSDVTNWTDYAVAPRTTLAIKGGTVFAWGTNAATFGDGSTSKYCTPAPGPSGSDWTRVDVVQGHAAGLRSDGTLWTWGSNYSGQLGDGTTADHLTPVEVGQGTRWLDISVGSSTFLGGFQRTGSSTMAIEDPS